MSEKLKEEELNEVNGGAGWVQPTVKCRDCGKVINTVEIHSYGRRCKACYEKFMGSMNVGMV